MTQVSVPYDSEFMTTSEVASRLHVHRFTVYMLLKEGRLRGFKLRHAWRIRRDEFDRFTASEWTPFEEAE